MSKAQYALLATIAIIWMASSIAFGLIAQSHRGSNRDSLCKTDEVNVMFFASLLSDVTVAQAKASPHYNRDYNKFANFIHDLKLAAPCDIHTLIPANVLTKTPK